jgi:AcrR family transcriptional regulator
VAHQRERILAAVAETISGMGYGQTAVEDIIACAGVSRRTFYDLFKNKEEAFLAAYDDGVERLFEAVTAACEQDGVWLRRARDGLAAFLEALAQFPEIAHMCIVDVLAAGPAALARRDAAVRRFVEIVDAARQELKLANVPAMAAETVVGGIHEVIYARILRDATADLPELLPDLAYSLLLPFSGQEAALAEYRRLSARRTRARTSA